MTSQQRRLVEHFGPKIGEIAGGGIASVLEMIATLPFRHVELHFTATSTARSRAWSVERYPGSILRVGRLRTVTPAPIVHVHMAGGGSVLREGSLVRLARAVRLRTVVTVHASDLEDVVRRQSHRLRRVLQSADVVHALGLESSRAL